MVFYVHYAVATHKVQLSGARTKSNLASYKNNSHKSSPVEELRGFFEEMKQNFSTTRQKKVELGQTITYLFVNNALNWLKRHVILSNKIKTLVYSDALKNYGENSFFKTQQDN